MFESWLSRFDAIVRRVRRQPPWAQWTGGLALLFVLMVLLMLSLGDRLFPQAKVASLMQQAETALAEGRLTAADGSGARELFEAALAMDPDRVASRAGLARVASAALVQADARLHAGDVPGAREALVLAQALSAPRDGIAAMQRRLRERENTLASADVLLERARQAQAEGRLHGQPDAALALYRQVLERQPARREALEGREDALAELLQQAHDALAAGQPQRAAGLVVAARGYDPGHVDLPQTEAELARAVEQLHQQAARALQRQRLDQAETGFRLLLQMDPGDARARRGLDDVAGAHLAVARRYAADFQFAQAEAALALARQIAPQLADIDVANQQVQQARRLQSRNATGQAPAEIGPRLQRLLAEARAAEARGDLLAPPGESAFDKLGAARALAPHDVQVQRASARLLPAAKRCFETELPRNNLARARTCLEARIALADDVGATNHARRRLAERWLAVGEERLGSGEINGANAALATAREVDPATPGIGGMQQRLQVAQAALARD